MCACNKNKINVLKHANINMAGFDLFGYLKSFTGANKMTELSQSVPYQNTNKSNPETEDASPLV
jgi:hypothetical protein